MNYINPEKIILCLNHDIQVKLSKYVKRKKRNHVYVVICIQECKTIRKRRLLIVFIDCKVRKMRIRKTCS